MVSSWFFCLVPLCFALQDPAPQDWKELVFKLGSAIASEREAAQKLLTQTAAEMSDKEWGNFRKVAPGLVSGDAEAKDRLQRVLTLASSWRSINALEGSRELKILLRKYAPIPHAATWEERITVFPNIVKEDSFTALSKEDKVTLVAIFKLEQVTDEHAKKRCMELLREFALDGLSPLFNKWIADPTPEVRIEAARCLLLSDPSQSQSILSKLLADRHLKPRLWGLKVIKETMVKSSAQAVEALLTDPEADARKEALLTLSAIAPEVVKAKVGALVLDRSPSVRATAIDLVAALGIADEVEAVESRMSDEDALVRCATARALHRFGRRDAGEKLFKLTEDADPFVRVTAASLLADRRTPEVEQRMVKLVDDPHPNVRLVALRTLTLWRSSECQDLLSKLVADKVPQNRVAALEALVVLGRDVDKGRWSKSVSALLEDHAPEVRRKAAEVAGYLQLLEVRPLLLRICEDRNQDVQVRTACVESLSLLGGAESVKACTLLLGDSNQWLRRSSIRVIALHGDKKDHELLTALLYDPVPQVRLDAARALAFRGQKINDDRLAKDLSSENPESRVEAIRVIGLVGTPEAVDKAVERFKDPAWEVRVAVARMLASIRSTQHGAILKTLATDSDLRVRAAAVRSKAILEQEKCIGDLRDALSDKDSAVVGTALEFLIRLEAVDKLKELAELVAKKEFPQNVHSSLAIAFATRGEIQLAKSLIMGPQQLSPDIRIAHNLVQLLESRPEMTAMIVRTADLYGKNFGGIMKVLADSLGSGIGWNFVPERATWIPDTWIDAGDQVPLTHVIGSTLNYYVVGLEFENKSIVVRAPHDPRPRPEDK